MDVQEVRNHDVRDRRLSRSNEQGYTFSELIVLLAVIMLIVGLAVPGILRVRKQAKNEASAVEMLRSVAVSQLAYAKSCGAGGYAVGFAALHQLAQNAESGLVTMEFGKTKSPRQNGYDFVLAAGAGSAAGPLDCHGIPTQTTYLATAQPVAFGFDGTGNRSFAITSEKTVWQNHSAIAPDEPFADPETPLQ